VREKRQHGADVWNIARDYGSGSDPTVSVPKTHLPPVPQSPGAFWKPPMAEIFSHIFTYICGIASGCILAAYLIRGA